MTRRRIRGAGRTSFVVGVLLAVVASCSVACGADRGGRVAAASGARLRSETIVVLAASSLTDAFADLADAFEAEHPGVTVDLSFDSSAALREQVLSGAPADVFASADVADMEALDDAGEIGPSVVFATNRLQIAVPASNPANVTGLQDLAREDLLVGLCVADAPCGRLSREALARTDVEPAPDTDEPNVRSLVAKLVSGDLDVGIVYRSDVVAAGGALEAIDLPVAAAVRVAHPIAALSASRNPSTAAAFVRFVASPDAAPVLERYGFSAP